VIKSESEKSDDFLERISNELKKNDSVPLHIRKILEELFEIELKYPTTEKDCFDRYEEIIKDNLQKNG